MYNYNEKSYRYIDTWYSCNNINKHGKKLPVKDDEIENFGTKPAFNRNLSPMGKYGIIP